MTSPFANLVFRYRHYFGNTNNFQPEIVDARWILDCVVRNAQTTESPQYTAYSYGVHILLHYYTYWFGIIYKYARPIPNSQEISWENYIAINRSTLKETEYVIG